MQDNKSIFGENQLKDINSPSEKKKGKSILNKIKKSFTDGFSPCPWTDYLSCIPQNKESIYKLMGDAELYMKGTQSSSENSEHSQYGGINSINSFIEQLKVGAELGSSVEDEINKSYDKIEEDRLKAASVIAYISRLFVLGNEEDVHKLRDFYRSKPYQMELDDVMYKLVSYLKNTRKS